MQRNRRPPKKEPKSNSLLKKLSTQKSLAEQF